MGLHDQADGKACMEGVAMNKPYTRVACCIDRDDMADIVVREGLRLAGGEGTSLRVVHVVAPPHTLASGPFGYTAPIVEMRDESIAWLEGVTGAIAGATPVVLDGSPSREICSWARANEIDLIVAAADRGLVERAMLGGFASYVAYHAPCSVLLVHRPAVAAGASVEATPATSQAL
jgi:nucleotide-binding universal stress UspA family protein